MCKSNTEEEAELMEEAEEEIPEEEVEEGEYEEDDDDEELPPQEVDDKVYFCFNLNDESTEVITRERFDELNLLQEIAEKNRLRKKSGVIGGTRKSFEEKDELELLLDESESSPDSDVQKEPNEKNAEALAINDDTQKLTLNETENNKTDNVNESKRIEIGEDDSKSSESESIPFDIGKINPNQSFIPREEALKNLEMEEISDSDFENEVELREMAEMVVDIDYNQIKNITKDNEPELKIENSLQQSEPPEKEEDNSSDMDISYNTSPEELNILNKEVTLEPELEVDHEPHPPGVTQITPSPVSSARVEKSKEYELCIPEDMGSTPTPPPPEKVPTPSPKTPELSPIEEENSSKTPEVEKVPTVTESIELEKDIENDDISIIEVYENNPSRKTKKQFLTNYLKIKKEKRVEIESSVSDDSSVKEISEEGEEAEVVDISDSEEEEKEKNETFDPNIKIKKEPINPLEFKSHSDYENYLKGQDPKIKFEDDDDVQVIGGLRTKHDKAFPLMTIKEDEEILLPKDEGNFLKKIKFNILLPKKIQEKSEEEVNNYRRVQFEKILNNIFDYLSFTNIKNCRCVCSHWRIELNPILSKRSIIKVKKGPKDLDKFYKDCKYLNYLTQLSSNVEIENITVKNLWKNVGKDIRHLSLKTWMWNGNPNYANTYKCLNFILSHYCPNLETLTLRKNNATTKVKAPDAEVDLTVPKLRYLNIFTQIESFFTYQFESILRNSPSLVKIVAFFSGEIFNLEVLLGILNKISLEVKEKDYFKNLDTIHIYYSFTLDPKKVVDTILVFTKKFEKKINFNIYFYDVGFFNNIVQTGRGRKTSAFKYPNDHNDLYKALANYKFEPKPETKVPSPESLGSSLASGSSAAAAALESVSAGASSQSQIDKKIIIYEAKCIG